MTRGLYGLGLSFQKPRVFIFVSNCYLDFTWDYFSINPTARTLCRKSYSCREGENVNLKLEQLKRSFYLYNLPIYTDSIFLESQIQNVGRGTRLAT